MTKRNNFTKTQMRAMRERSKDICEAGKNGTEVFYGMAKGEKCSAKAAEFDHVTADALKRTKIKDIDEGLHVCRPHHKNKTHKHDIPAINKAKRLNENAAGVKKSKMPFPQRPKVQIVATSGTSKGEAAHRANMAAKGKRIVPRRFM
jgi:hypothetical protein